MNALALRTKLILVVTFILIAGFAATNILNYQVSKGALRTTILENELPLSSNNVYSAIQADLLRPIFISSLMANDTFVHDWVKEGEREPERMVRYLAQIRDRYDAFTSYFISDRSNRYYHFEGISRTLNEDNPEDGWFFEARNMKEPYAVNVDFNYQQNRNITIFINYRVEDDNGHFLGVTGVGLGLQSVANLVKQYQTQFRRNVYFVDQTGLIRVHANEALAGKVRIHDIHGLDVVSNDVLSNQRGSYAYEGKNGKVLLTTRYIPELKWYLFIELPESQALEDIKRGFIRNLLIGPAVIVITILLIIYTINIFQRRLEDMAITDKLTGLHNRQHFDTMLSQAVKRYQRDRRVFSVLMIDIDHFKPINDKLGHLAGDAAIQQVANMISERTRESDMLCRWGGEEFMILASDCNAEDAQKLAEEIRIAISEATLFPSSPELSVTISVGIGEMKAEDTEQTLVARADKALYQAKDNGRNRTKMA